MPVKDISELGIKGWLGKHFTKQLKTSKLLTMGSYKYTLQAFKAWERSRHKANKQAQEQAYKDMAETVPTTRAVTDPYFDTWDVSRSKVFTSEQVNLNKKLTFL